MQQQAVQQQLRAQEQQQQQAQQNSGSAAAGTSMDGSAGAAAVGAAVGGASHEAAGLPRRRKSPYHQALQKCDSLACLKEAALTKERHPGQFRFPHFFVIGWQVGRRPAIVACAGWRQALCVCRCTHGVPWRHDLDPWHSCMPWGFMRMRTSTSHPGLRGSRFPSLPLPALPAEVRHNLAVPPLGAAPRGPVPQCQGDRPHPCGPTPLAIARALETSAGRALSSQCLRHR